MADKQKQKKRQKQAERSSGKRKGKKTLEKAPDSEPEQIAIPKPRARPLTVRLPAPVHAAASARSETTAEADAVAALVAIGGRPAVEYEDRMDQIFAATVPGVSVGDLRKEREGKEGSGSDDEEETDDSDSESSDDDDLADSVPVSSPSHDANSRRNKFTMTFQVPYNGASRELDIESITPFNTFLDELATAMSTRKSLLSGIAYLPSYLPKNPKPIPKLLEDGKSWKKLIQSVEAYIAAEKEKKKGNGVPRPFSILIIDTSGGDPKGKVSATKKGKKDTSEQSEPPSDKKEHVFYRQLEQKYHCAEHEKPCAVLSDGTHYHLTDNDLSKWAYLIVKPDLVQSQHRATVDTLPKDLKIEDAVPRQHAARKAMARNGQEASEPPAWLLPFMGMAMGGVMRNNLAFETPQQPAVHHPLTPAAGPSRRAAYDSDPPSSGTKRAAGIAAPSIWTWLASLDSDTEDRGRHAGKINYSSYSLKFDDNGMYNLTDMEGVDATQLSSLIGAPIGIAQRMVKYAKEDLEKLSNAVKRARRV
ncbi:hypothetical protein DFH07DRAFT_780075 [Mycena maculata]|uniref:Uncharacterized protein n=1 Tax=Mycena maculata TaxID=230809 RepID=A0AAD7I687_9AGAR|nr:hypothetical protein DFH07DRAFT_780075 [Mycena maculata]